MVLLGYLRVNIELIRLRWSPHESRCSHDILDFRNS